MIKSEPGQLQRHRAAPGQQPGKLIKAPYIFILKNAPAALVFARAVSPGSRGADLWKDALHTFFCGDAELKEYVQRIAGLALIGHVYIEALIIAHGDGRNGKSTF